MHLLTMCLPKKSTQIFTHEYERCVNISAICRHTKHLTAWMRDIIKYAERTGAVGLSMNDLFLGLWHPSVVMSTCHNLLSYSLMLQIDHLFWDPYSLLAIFCHLFERHLVHCSCNVISGQPHTGEGGSAVLITKLGSLSSAVLQCWGCLVSSSLHPLATGYSGYPPARNIEISDLQSDHALPPARSWDRVLLTSNCC